MLLCRAPFKIAEMKNLKHLALKVPIGKSLMGYTTFFIAAPRLVTFKMEVSNLSLLIVLDNIVVHLTKICRVEQVN